MQVDFTFDHSWQAEILRQRPPILPSRHFTYPREAEEIERGALEVMICPDAGAPFLATFALGFADPSAPTGVWACPHREELCALAGGYAYVVNCGEPARFTQISFRPVLEVRALPDHGLLLFVGSQGLIAWGREGQVWQSPRLSSEGLRLAEIRGNELSGFGWDLLRDQEIPFTVNLGTGQTSGPHPAMVR